jgi:hypothetical protein
MNSAAYLTFNYDRDALPQSIEAGFDLLILSQAAALSRGRGVNIFGSAQESGGLADRRGFPLHSAV